MNKEAQNMRAISLAKKDHDVNCPYGGAAKRICMTPFDIERMEWVEGDVIAGLVLTADTGLATGRMRVECDAEPNSGGPKEEITEEVKKKDLVHA